MTIHEFSVVYLLIHYIMYFCLQLYVNLQKIVCLLSVYYGAVFKYSSTFMRNIVFKRLTLLL